MPRKLSFQSMPLRSHRPATRVFAPCVLNIAVLAYVALVLFAPPAAAAAAAAVQAADGQDAAAPPAVVQTAAAWADIDGNPLPFRDVAEIAAFLRTAKIVDNQPIDIGTTGPRRLTLEQDGIRAYAAFRGVDETHTRVRLPDGNYYQRLRDYCGFEIAAYEISRLLGMDNVPPAVARRVDGALGSLQIWVADTMMEGERVEQKLRSPDPMSWRRQAQEMLIFDDLIGNVDRNLGNVLIDPRWKIWLIDHTRAFQQGAKLTNEAKITWVRQGLWKQLRALDVDSVDDRAGSVLDRRELRDLFERRDLLVARIEALIAERGAGAVLYDR